MSERIILSNSALSTPKLCMQKAFLTIRHRLDAKSVGVALRVGSATHDMLEAFYKGTEDPDVLSDVAVARYQKGISAHLPKMPPSQLQDYHKMEAVVGGIPYGYCSHYSEDLDRWEVLGTEVPVVTRIMNPDTGDLHPKFDYGMKLDLLVRDRVTGLTHLVEHKTTGKPSSVYFEKLLLDPQLTGYVIGAEAIGYHIDSTIYNVIIKPGIRQKKSETREEFYQRYADAMYEEPEKYFNRTKEIQHTDAQRYNFMRDLWRWVEYLTYMWDRPQDDWLRSHINACVDFQRMCPFVGLCAEGMDSPHILEFSRREHQNPELEM